MPPAASLLSVLLAGAFGLQLIAVISTPIVKGIPLGTSGDLTFGAFGFCQGDTCTPIGIGYKVDENDSSFDLSSTSTRHTLSSILVIHPIAAFFTLVLLSCGIASHFHGPSHSTRFLLGFIVLFIPTFVLSLLAFLIDVLLFIPHLAWGGWIMLAATIIIAVCGILTCAMRRTLVSRKSRKDRVAQNAEMSGQNFYTRQNASGGGASSPPPLAQQPTAPMVTGSPGADKLPTFTTFESSKSRISGEDDRMPLNSADRTATGMSSNMSAGRPSMDGMERYGGGRGGAITQGRGGRGHGPPRDQYGNIIPPPNPYGPQGSAGRGSAMGHGPAPYSQETLVSGGSSSRSGRGGYPPRGGAYPRGAPYGGRGGRGGPPGQMMGRGGPSPRGGYRGPPGAPPNGPPGPYGAGYNASNSPYGRRPSDPRYAPSPGPPPPAPAPYGAAYANAQPESSSHESFYPRAESPPPLENDHISPVSAHSPQDPPHDMMQHHAAIGQAIEMDEKTGSPAPPPGTCVPPLRHFSEGDTDVDGMVGLQQSRSGPGQPISPSSAYSSQRTDSYATAPRPWTGAPGRNGTPPLPNNAAAGGDLSRPSSARRSPPVIMQTSSTPQPQRARIGSGDNYYEDVDARFAPDEEGSPQGAQQRTQVVHGGPTPPPPNANLGVPYRPGLEAQKSYDSVADGPESDASNFTSISQRPVNPQWAEEAYGPGGAGGGYGYGGVPNRQPQPQPQQRRDVMLNNNPDFEMSRGAGGRGRGGRM